MNHFVFLPANLVYFALLVTLSAASPDVILYNGKIVSVDRSFSIHQAMSITGERIAAVGSNEELLGNKSPRTKLINLRGNTVLPGLIDSHTHPLGAAMIEFDHELPNMQSIRDVLSYIHSRARVVKEGEWIVLQQVFITRLREQRYPSRQELDDAAPRHPVAFRTGPDASLNSLALERLGINRGFKLPEGVAGRIEENQSGEPTGILRNFADYAKIPEAAAARQPTREDKISRLKALFADYNSVGLTTICDRNASPEALELYRIMLERNDLTIRITASHALGTGGSVSNIQESIRKIAQHPLATRGAHSSRDWLRIIGVKAFLDGGMLTGSAYMREPWGVSGIYGIDDPHYHGLLFIPREKLLPIVRTTIENGLQFTAHSVGDGAVHTLLDVYDQIARTYTGTDGLRETRPCITHCNFMSREAIQRMASLGVVADIQPAWLYLDAVTLEKQFGYERLRWFQPLRSLFNAGVTVGGGSDHMQKIGPLRSINFYDPFLAIQTAVTREPKGGRGPLHPEEALSREQAIRFYTSNNAHLLFSEDTLGSLEPGKFADFVISDTDLLGCRPSRIQRAKVLATWLAGRQIYRR
jgi:predicted amidohydrolase YtcJ